MSLIGFSCTLFILGIESLAQNIQIRGKQSNCDVKVNEKRVFFFLSLFFFAIHFVFYSIFWLVFFVSFFTCDKKFNLLSIVTPSTFSSWLYLTLLFWQVRSIVCLLLPMTMKWHLSGLTPYNCHENKQKSFRNLFLYRLLILKKNLLVV